MLLYKKGKCFEDEFTSTTLAPPPKRQKLNPRAHFQLMKRKKNEKTPEQINALIQLRYNENMQFQQKMHI